MAAPNLSNRILKTGATDSKYQSTFLPIFQDAETRIKMLVLSFFLLGKSKQLLIIMILKIIAEVEEKIPKDLFNRDAYIAGMQKRSVVYVNKFYAQPMRRFEMAKNRLINTKPANVELPNIKTPQEMVQYVQKNKADMWPEAKGSPYVMNYDKEVFKKMDEFAEMPLTTYESGKKPISLWQKAELDVRYTHQMDAFDEMVAKGVKLAYLSTHPDCSVRCSCWQGSLVSLTEHAASPQTTVDRKFKYNKRSFLVRYENRKPVYSLLDIMAVKDQYGYRNNIYSGFNCRHRLIEYKSDELPPKQYDEKDVAKQRAIEEKIRKMEREIRLQKTRLLFYEKLGEKKVAKEIRVRVKMLIENYKRFCEANGYAWQQYRINIREGSNKYL